MNDLKTDLNLILRVKCESCGCQQTYISKDNGFKCIKCGNKKYEFLECYKDRNVPRIIPNGKVGNPTNQSVVTLLGTPTTVGELKALLANYSDDTSFGFRNQPIQSLHEIKYAEFTGVVFDDIVTRSEVRCSCGICNGTGVIDNSPCSECFGAGVLYR